MNLRFLPFVFGMMVVSSATNAETFDEVITESLTANDTYIYGNMELNNKSGGLKINLPRAAENYSNFIECKNNNIAVYSTMFSVSSSGSIAGTGLCIKESSADNTYSATLGINFNKDYKLFDFSTSSYPGTLPEKYYPMRFSAEEFTFDKGDMVVNGATTLKGGVAIEGGAGNYNSLMDISIPKGEDPTYIIYASDLNLPTNQGIFAVTNDGGLHCQDWVVTERNVGAPYNGGLSCTYNNDEGGFEFATFGYKRNYPISFDANKFTFNGGGLEVQKETVLDSMLQVKGKTVLDSMLQVKGMTVLDSMLQVKGMTVLDSTLQVKGETVLDSMLQVKGKTVLDSTLQVKGESVLDSTLQVNGKTALNSTLQVKGKTVLDSTLLVNGKTALNSTLRVKGESVLDSTLLVNGKTALNSTLLVNGKTALNSTLQVKGKTVLDSTLQLKGETVLDSTLQVNGVTVLDSTLQVKNGATFSEDVKVWGETNLSTLKINIPTIQVDKSGAKERAYGNFIDCHDVLTPAYNNMFKVSYDGHVGAVSLGLSASPLDNGNCAKFHCGYNKTDEAWLIDTESYGGQQNKFYPIIFRAGGYTFDSGDMVVNGTLTCKNELNVLSLNADDVNVNMKNVADYVFDENYNLKSLSEVESFVKENKHLPGIPSAAEMEENGVSLAKMSNMLLEKVEELTLHLIRLEKENAELKAKFEALEK